MVEKIPSWIERLLLPKLSEIAGELKAVNTRIDSVERRIDSVEKRLESFETRIGSLELRVGSVEKHVERLENQLNTLHKTMDDRLTSLRGEMLAKFEMLNTRLQVTEHIATLEAKIREIESKLAKE
ncbi:MAG: hypothetical protein NXY59_01785 [Aigarchaeota archaeon]|nr:hypothetical protein [Candidatus Pelearchaeum maunauluense]